MKPVCVVTSEKLAAQSKGLTKKNIIFGHLTKFLVVLQAERFSTPPRIYLHVCIREWLRACACLSVCAYPSISFSIFYPSFKLHIHISFFFIDISLSTMMLNSFLIMISESGMTFRICARILEF